LIPAALFGSLIGRSMDEPVDPDPEGQTLDIARDAVSGSSLSGRDLNKLLIRSLKSVRPGSFLVRLDAPVIVCGSINGQSAQLSAIFRQFGAPSDSGPTYLFLGDYCGRGPDPVGTVVLLLAFKMMYPTKIHLLRGAQERSYDNRYSPLFQICLRTYTIATWRKFNGVFDELPVAAIIGDQYFCACGGPSPRLNELAQLDGIDRAFETPEVGLVCDLVTAVPRFGRVVDNQKVVLYLDDSKRTVYTMDAVAQFCEKNHCRCICVCGEANRPSGGNDTQRNFVRLVSAPVPGGGTGRVMVIDADLERSFEPCRRGD
jgi:serine/threonine-protein phosphatase PP1 catalytic subunit